MTAERDEREVAELSRALGAGTVGRGMPAGAAAQLAELERQHKARAKRMQRDALDRALTDLASFYRDVLVVQLGADVGLVNEELRPALVSAAASTTPEQSLRRIDAILACKVAIEGNVAALLAVEAMALALRSG
jgi:DNA polymerase-3 subunit delta'